MGRQIERWAALLFTAMIDSTSNPTVKSLRLLTTSKGRRDQGRFLAEGVRLVEDGLEAGELPVTCLYNYELLGRTERGRGLLQRLAASGVTPLEASERALAAASDTQHPQGIVAAFPVRQRPLPNAAGKRALALICDGVQDPGNLGTLLRTAEAAAAHAAFLSPGCADPYNPKVVRSAMGAHFRLSLCQGDWREIYDGLHLLRIPPTAIYASDTSGNLTYDLVDWTLPSALIVSNEAHGLSDEARELASGTALLNIPMAGATESLNAAVAGAVIMFEAARQRRVASL